MIKLAANAALMTRISFINEIANVCEATGADVVQGRRGDRPRPPDRHELPPRRDRLRRLVLPEGLAGAEAARRELRLPLPAPERRDRGQRAPEAPRRSASCSEHLGSLRGKRVALLGLAFKPHTDDMREAPSLVLAGRLLAEGADVRAWDPIADGRRPARRRAAPRRSRRRVAGADARRARDRVAGARRASTGQRCAATMRTRGCSSTAATSSTRTRCALPASSTRASGAPRGQPGRTDGGHRPCGRQGRASRRRRGRDARSRSCPSAGRPLAGVADRAPPVAPG